MSKINESTWKPIKIGDNSGYSITNYSVSTSWFNKTCDVSGTRRNKLRKFHEADMISIEISRALDVIAEDITAVNADDNAVFEIDFPDDYKIKKTTLKILNNALGMWEKRTEMDSKFFSRVRKTLKYGATFYRKNTDGTLTELPTERFVGYIVSNEDETKVTHYLYDETLPRLDEAGRISDAIKQNNVSVGSNKSGYTSISVDDLVIFKIGETPFGESLIEKVYGLWKQMKLLEDSVVIYRVTRSPERRVFYIDTGNLQGPKRAKAIEDQRLKLMQKKSNRSGELTSEYDPHSTTEDIFIPTNSSGKGSRVETLPAGQNLGEVGDLEWFAKKMAMGLRIPSSMIDAQRDQDRDQYSDMRVGQLYTIEMRYLGHIKRLKLPIKTELEKNFREFCIDRDIIPPEEMEFIVNDSMSFAQYKQMELSQQILNIASSTLSFPYLSKKVVLQKYLDFDQEEILDNEIEKLLELGIPEEKIKDMTDEDRSHLVYSEQRNPEILKKYGLETETDPMGGF